MFGSLDPAKLLVVLVLALIVLGPERLPKVARQLGGAWREVTRMRDQVTEEVRNAMPDLDLPDIPRIPSTRGAISGFLTDLTNSAGSSTGSGATGAETVEASEEDSPFARPVDPEAASAAPGAARFTNERSGESPRLVVHPTLGEVAFVPDDPSMN